MSQHRARYALDRLASAVKLGTMGAYACALEGLAAQERSHEGPWWDQVVEAARDAVVARLSAGDRSLWAREWLETR